MRNGNMGECGCFAIPSKKYLNLFSISFHLPPLIIAQGPNRGPTQGPGIAPQPPQKPRIPQTEAVLKGSTSHSPEGGPSSARFPPGSETTPLKTAQVRDYSGGGVDTPPLSHFPGFQIVLPWIIYFSCPHWTRESN